MNVELATEAVRAAAQLRADKGIGPSEGLCPYDLAIKLGIKVNFLHADSLEGMYSPDPPPPSIILPSVRSSGRRRYSCAHEIGHHIFKHGFKIDEMDESNSSSSSPEEYLAQRFASALLMPKLAVDSAFTKRGWNARSPTDQQCFVVAQDLGVGYTSLIFSLEKNLKYISSQVASKLSGVSRKELVRRVAGKPVAFDAYLVDEHWSRKTVDVEVGDLIVFSDRIVFDGSCAAVDDQTGSRFMAVSSGSGTIKLNGGRTISLRVSKRNFAGLARYRHLEDENE